MLSPAVAVPRDVATAEQDDFTVLSRAVVAPERADDRNALLQTPAQVATTVDRTRKGFSAADHARMTAAEEYSAANHAALALAVTCDRGCPAQGRRAGSRVLPPGWSGHLPFTAMVSFANLTPPIST